MAKVTLTFSLDSEEHRDILAFFDALRPGEKSQAFREMAQAYISNRLTLADLYQELTEIRRLLKAGAVVSDNPAGDDQEDPLVAKVEGLLSTLGL